MKKKTVTVVCVITVCVFTLFLGIINAFAQTDSGIVGDVNGDGEINVCDCVYIYLIVDGKKPDNIKADIDYDGETTKKDAEILADYVVGKREKLPKNPKEDEVETPII